MRRTISGLHLRLSGRSCWPQGRRASSLLRSTFVTACNTFVRRILVAWSARDVCLWLPGPAPGRHDSRVMTWWPRQSGAGVSCGRVIRTRLAPMGFLSRGPRPRRRLPSGRCPPHRRSSAPHATDRQILLCGRSSAVPLQGAALAIPLHRQAARLPGHRFHLADPGIAVHHLTRGGTTPSAPPDCPSSSRLPSRAPGRLTAGHHLARRVPGRGGRRR